MCKKSILQTRGFKGQKPDECLEKQHLNDVLRCGNCSMSRITDSGPLNYYKIRCAFFSNISIALLSIIPYVVYTVLKAMSMMTK